MRERCKEDENFFVKLRSKSKNKDDLLVCWERGGGGNEIFNLGIFKLTRLNVDCGC